MASIVNTKGVDISSWNGDIDLSKVKKAGYEWVMIRCGFGNDVTSKDDNRFEANVKKAEAIGMPWGAYFYTYSLSEADDKSELNHILRLLKGKKPTLPIAIDVEDADNYKSKKGGWNYSNVNRNAKYLLEGLAKNGYYPMLYTGFEEIENYISESVWRKYDMWFAHWARSCGYKENNLSMWQYGGETNLIDGNSISGVGTIDKDMVYKDYPTIIKNGGYNNWSKATTQSTGIKLGCSAVHTYAWCQYAFSQTGATNPKWSTSNTSISKIDQNGVLSTTAAGTTTVTVTDGKYSASCPVTIDAGRVTNISKSAITLDKGQTEALTAKEGVSWWSSNKNVATVDNKGKVTAKATGYATISAYNNEGASTCLVTVTNNTYTPPVKEITETELRQKCVNTINSWLGATEGSSTHKTILNIYNSQKNLDYQMGTSDAWCAATVSAVWLKVGIADYICTSVNCGTLRDKAISKGIWVENDAYVPKIADAIIYSWSDSGVGDNTGSADHVGMVTAVNGNSFTVTEGNTGNGIVGQRTMQVNGRYIRGFIAPNYADIAKKVSGKITPDTVKPVTAPNIFVQGVADKWLNVGKNGTTGKIGSALKGFAVKVDNGSIEYSAHVKGGNWLEKVTGWDYKDFNNGYAGNGNPGETGTVIDGIKIYYTTPYDIIEAFGYYRVAYRVHLLNRDWTDWQYDTETSNGQKGYVGTFGTEIDQIQVKLVK